jgi:hypothetical protein
MGSNSSKTSKTETSTNDTNNNEDSFQDNLEEFHHDSDKRNNDILINQKSIFSSPVRQLTINKRRDNIASTDIFEREKDRDNTRNNTADQKLRQNRGDWEESPGRKNNIFKKHSNLAKLSSLQQRAITPNTADSNSDFSDLSPVHDLKKRSSLSTTSLKRESTLRDSSEKRVIKKIHTFHLATIVIPSIVSLWYSIAILFPPGARTKYYYLLWDDGQLIFNDEGQPSLCPRSSICSEGVMQVVLISIARLSAFASYVVMGITFLSKMHHSIRFLSSSYLRTFIPFESLHHIHENTGTYFAVLAFVHTITHYFRYILRQDINQLGTQVHVSGLCGTLSMLIIIISMSSFAKKFKDTIGTFERRLNTHWMFVILCIALCFHHERTRIITLIFL